ncbi:MAG: hypothetical protein JNL57_06975 [Bacteroidetes bacterium]|nr:hypothetical protein [Bacteroidota bacterium]
MLYPFQTIYLRTSLNRNDVQEQLKSVTFLPEVPRTQQKTTGIFYGSVSPDQFDIEYIGDKPGYCQFISGEIKGLEDEIYLILRMGAFRHRRFYLLLCAFYFVSLALVASDFMQNGTPSLQRWPAVVFGFVFIILTGYCTTYLWRFQRTKARTVLYLRGMFQADEVTASDLPVVFRL